MINGIINVYKERGFTSFDVVAKLRGILHERKIGHTGTLDPEATGVLPVCIGNATKVCELLTDKDKVYRTVMHLGITTDTQDMTGTVKEDRSREAALLKEQTVEAAILQFVGDYEQIPPMYSALKVNGKKLCDLARAGIEVERKARTVKIFSIEIEKINLPYVTMQVHCSKGTYIRTLCADIGEVLGVGACMESLVRTRVSVFPLEEAHTLAEIEKISEVEGAKLKADVAGRAQTILDCVAFVEERSPQTVREYNEKLAARVHELLGDVTLDEGRLLQETAIFADKVAVAEETVRLRSHIAQLGKFLEAEEPIGRKMDFLVQEINREANTIGSKASDVAIAGKVIDIKAEVEKIREQIQNIE